MTIPLSHSDVNPSPRREGDATVPSARDPIFGGFLEFAPDAIVIINREGRIKIVNTQAENLFGYAREEMIDQAIEILLPDRLKDVHAEHRIRYFTEPGTRPMGAGLDLAARRKDGTEVPVEISLSPLETDEGILITSVIRDITDRRRIQDQLETRACQQAIVAELGHRALLSTDLAKVMEEAVSLVAQTLGVDQVGVFELLTGDQAFLLQAGVGWNDGSVGQATLPIGTQSQAGFTLLSNEPLNVADLDLETRFERPPLLLEHGVVSVTSVILYVQNRPYGVLEAHARRRQAFSQDDIHFLQAIANVLAASIERRRAEQLQRERDYLRAEQMLAVGQVAASVAHELRNPLTSIKGLIQINCKEVESQGLPTEDLRVIEQEIRRMERILQSFLDFSRPPEPERHRQDLLPLVNKTLALIRGRADKQNVTLELSQPSMPVFVAVDGEQIQQLLLNLTLNSLDAMMQGGKLQIEIRPPLHGQVEVHVFDSGPGIAPDLLQRVFDPFVSGKENGMGLGLAISRRIAEDHGGGLVVSNRSRGGAIFVLRLPDEVPG